MLETTIGTLSSKKIPFFFSIFTVIHDNRKTYFDKRAYLPYQSNLMNLKNKNDLRVNWKAGVIFEP